MMALSCRKFGFMGLVMASLATPVRAEPLTVYAAGSLKAAVGDVAEAYTARFADPVTTTFAASGLLRKRIEAGERPSVFLSANMRHPTTLQDEGITAGPVVLFARNRLCALAQPESVVTPQSLLDTLLRDDVRLGTSTPKADPSGDYAFELFAKAEQQVPGAQARLEAKALQLTGGETSEKAPEGRNTYAWVMAERRADIFLTYCTNAALAQRDVPSLRIVSIPDALSVGADYGLIVIGETEPSAWRFAAFVLSPEAQEILAGYGFAVGGLKAE